MSDHHQRDHKGNCHPDCIGCEVERLRLEATKTNEISEENTKLRVLIRRLTEHIDDLEEKLWG